jgi:DNA polymerase
VAFREKPEGCVGCPAYEIGKSYVPGTGPRGARFALIGQGPGETEAYAGKPFCGPSGNKLDKWLIRAGLARHEAWVDNIVRCWLPKNRAPRTSESSYCTHTHLYPALLDLTNLDLVVPIGVPAMKALIHRGASERTAGSQLEITLECTPKIPPISPS